MPDGLSFTTATILIDGAPLDAGFELISLEVRRAVNRIPVAELTVQAPGPVASDVPLMSGGPFKPAALVELRLRDAGTPDVSIITGAVTALGLRSRSGVMTLTVTVKDKAVGLTGARRSRVWTETSDADAVSDIIQKAGLNAGDIPSTQPTHKALVQHECTDWDFILTRADALGLVVTVVDGTISLRKMDVSAAAARTLTYGMDPVTDVDFEVDASTQTSGMSSLVWDPDQLTAASPADGLNLMLAQGKVDGGDAAGSLGLGAVHLTHMVPLSADEAKTWATARLARARLALFRGRLTMAGMPDVKIMETTELSGFGAQIDGKALVTGVRHRLDNVSGFTTDLQFGLSPDPVGRLPDLADIPAGGLLPHIPGVHVGTVTDNEDPEALGRVRVSVPSIATEAEAALWARLVAPDAGPGRGFCFLPEIGDEVLVAFLGSDPRYPVVLGGLHGSKNVLPDGFSDNKKKGIVTTKGVQVMFSETDKPSITLITPGKRMVVLDDDGKTITLSDGDNNKITLDANGITVEAGKDLTLKASGAVKVTGATIDLN